MICRQSTLDEWVVLKHSIGFFVSYLPTSFEPKSCIDEYIQLLAELHFFPELQLRQLTYVCADRKDIVLFE